MTETKEKSTKKRERSVAYPSVPLENSIELTRQLYENVGKNPCSREEAARALGYSGLSGASARAVAALVHYGLLERQGDTYTISNLAIQILHPTDETGMDRKEAVITAAQTPRLFAKLIESHKGQALPRLLENIMMREGIARKYAKDAATTFRETLEFSGLLKNGVLQVSPGTNISDTAGVDFEERVHNQSAVETTPAAGLGEEKRNISPGYSFTDSGTGWAIIIKSQIPITAKIKNELATIAEILQESNAQNEQ